MKLEDIILSEINQIKKVCGSTLWFHLYEGPRVVNFIETESKTWSCLEAGRADLVFNGQGVSVGEDETVWR